MIFLLSSHSKLAAIFGLCHAILPLLPRPIQESICPLGYSYGLLSWSAESAVLAASLLGGGIMRFLAFHQLQQNFTFAIAKPTKSVRTGLCAYMQHSSYTGAILLVSGFCTLVLRTGGVLTSWSTISALDLVGRFLGYVSNIYYTLLVILVIPRRIGQEEELLRKAFGEEWIEYQRSTARLIPWVF
ncbi:hypothetical protein BDW72DRAFT_208283 [Aspergillus terricola var. indicus]